MSARKMVATRRRSEPQQPVAAPRQEPIHWLSSRQRLDMERDARRERREQHRNQIGRPLARPPLRRDSAYSSDEEAEKTLVVEQRQHNRYPHASSIRATGRSFAALASAWDDPAQEVDLPICISSDQENDDVKPIGDKIPILDRPYSISVWEHALPSQLRAIFARRPDLRRRSTTMLKDHGLF